MAGQDRNFNWKNLVENCYLTTRRICVLTHLSDLIVEGQTREEEGKKVSKKWLLECEHFKRSEIRSWDEFPLRLLNSIIVQIGVCSKELPGCDEIFNEFIEETHAISESFTKSHHGIDLKKEDKKQLSELGYSYLFLAIAFIKTYSEYFESVFKELHPDSQLADVMGDVPNDYHAIFKRYELISYLLGYAGIRLVANAHLKAKENCWCVGCFRPAEDNKKSCHLHTRISTNKSDFEFADKVMNKLKEKDDTLILHWNDVRECIIRNKVLDRKYDEQLIEIPLEWKVLLIKRINGSPFLSKKIDIKKIQSSKNWVDAIKYLFHQIDIKNEDSMCIESVLSFLSMAEKWFEVEDLYMSPAGNRMSSTRGDPTGLPTLRLIIDLCETTPGITTAEIAKKLNRSLHLIMKNVRKHGLEKYFHRY